VAGCTGAVERIKEIDNLAFECGFIVGAQAHLPPLQPKKRSYPSAARSVTTNCHSTSSTDHETEQKPAVH